MTHLITRTGDDRPARAGLASRHQFQPQEVAMFEGTPSSSRVRSFISRTAKEDSPGPASDPNPRIPEDARLARHRRVVRAAREPDRWSSGANGGRGDEDRLAATESNREAPEALPAAPSAESCRTTMGGPNR